MKISVVTISYNQARFLGACIDSVACQDGPWEHIIVDPGSEDGSREVIAERAPHFSHMVLEPDSGPADGLNKGFNMASGEIYYYLNSDDILLPGAFKEVRDLFRRSPDVDVLAGAAYVIDEVGNFGRRLWSDPVSRMGLANGGSIQIQPSTFIRRDAFKRTGGFNRLNRSNWDGELVVDLFELGAVFRQVDRLWSGYRIHAESITGSASLDAKIHAHGRKMYERLIGKSPGRFASLASQYFRLRRVLRHPSVIYERSRFGKVYGGRV